MWVRRLRECAGAVIAVALTVAGPNLSCVPPEPAATSALSLPLEVETSGTLKGGESRSYELPVQADVQYAISLAGTAGMIGVPDLRAQIIGPTSPENVELSVRGLSLLRPEDVKGFRATQDGALELRLENRTEGLTISQGILGSILGDVSEVEYRVKATVLGVDDHGRSPDEPTRLLDDGQPVFGEILFGNDFDYFIISVEAGRRYQVTLEASGSAKLATSSVDRFDQFNFDVAPSGGTEFSIEASAGNPTTKRVTANQTRDIMLGLAPGPENLLAGIFGVPPGFDSFPVKYAITITSSLGGQLTSGDAVEDVVAKGDALEFYIDVPAETQQITTELTGPQGLIVYINPNAPGSMLEYQAFVAPVIEGVAASKTTTPVPGTSRYFFTAKSLVEGNAAFSLRVTLE